MTCPAKARHQKKSLSEVVDFWENVIEDFNLAEQQIIREWHWTPSQYEAEDFYRTSEIFSAKPEEEREVDPATLL
ncbi:hypothetical protein WJM93_15515 [Lactiplantibacillus plantarum]|uniref:hypothetical protein n=1 Tax=Lactiplantibacillus plantarum TaxID=1590 RepID=UPI0030B0BF70